MLITHIVYFYQPNLVPGYHYPTNEYDFDGSWNQAASYLLNRAYDYVHVSAAYWSLYRVGRNYPQLVSRVRIPLLKLESSNTHIKV